MKKLVRYLVVMLTAALMSLALFACGAEGAKYNYTKTSIEGDSNMVSAMSSVATMYDNMYKDSTLTVGSSSVTWKIKDTEEKLVSKKDGDKYILGGEFVDTMKNSLSGMGGAMGDVSIEIWGAETDGGFKIVIEETISGLSVSIVMNFAKA